MVLYVYLFLRDLYVSGISAESSALIHEYTNIFVNNDFKRESSRYADSWLRLWVVILNFLLFPLKFGCAKISTRTVFMLLKSGIFSFSATGFYQHENNTLMPLIPKQNFFLESKYNIIFILKLYCGDKYA